MVHNNTKRKRVRLVSEANPSRRALRATEVDAQALGMDLATYEVYLRLHLPGKVHGYAPSRAADRPTRAMPGSEEKIRVMTERARLRMSLFHPGDAVLPPEPQGVEP